MNSTKLTSALLVCLLAVVAAFAVCIRQRKAYREWRALHYEDVRMQQ